ncbi:hypothetical protein Pelo_2295 [Pelomyxa schiedti]|nr:hypothetical protein Pelo_2295 [Pelomyxa schiedti]
MIGPVFSHTKGMSAEGTKVASLDGGGPTTKITNGVGGGGDVAEDEEQFMQYLCGGGVVDLLTTVVARLRHQHQLGNPPGDPLVFLKANIGGILGVDLEGLINENAALKKKVTQQAATIETLQAQLNALPSQPPIKERSNTTQTTSSATETPQIKLSSNS